MEGTRAVKMDSVLLQQGKECSRGSLHLTRHHLIFYSEQGNERWIPYALLALVTRQASLLPLKGNANRRPVSPFPNQGETGPSKSTANPAVRSGRIYPLQLRFRTFEACSLGFETEIKATEVFETLKEMAIFASIDDLYAFYYQPHTPFSFQAGWSLYQPKLEFMRQGVGSRSKAWRFTSLNSHYEFSPTYPAEIIVPAKISDTTLQHAAKYRSKARLPALTYLHWANNGSITRCAQPLPGLKQARSVQDEKVVEAIFSSHLFSSPSLGNASSSGVRPVYGATSTNVIVDARPTTNAVATYARGGGTENMDHYKSCKKAYLGIENIHTMRDSINRVIEVLRAADEPTTFGMEIDFPHDHEKEMGRTLDDALTEADLLRSTDGPSYLGVPEQARGAGSLQVRQPLDVAGLRRSNWLRHLSCLLEGSALIVRNIHIASSHVLIHCSDGWDRTSQLSTLSQICLDPYYRTMQGFAVLVEKDWLSFGHRFTDRCGHGGSAKSYITASGHDDASDDEDSEEVEAAGIGGASTGGAQAAANAFWGFTKQLTANLGGSTPGGNSQHDAAVGPGSHIKETSPIFTQFLDCVWQIMRQNPHRFEFNKEWLASLHRELYECRFGTFLVNSERERQLPLRDKKPVVQSTFSVWDYMLSDENKEKFRNSIYDKSLDDPKRIDADMGVLLIKSNDVRWWSGLFGRRIEEANKALDFEEAERRRRKAEKLRWEEERRARKEQEENKRQQLEEEQRQRLGLQWTASTSDGAVDLTTASGLQRQQQEHYKQQAEASIGQIDPTKLTYQPRAPRNKTAQPPASVEQRSPRAPEISQPFAPASEAAARFKSWAIGGWDRFQEAVTASSLSSVLSEDRHSAWGSDHSSVSRDLWMNGSTTTIMAPLASEESNPWALDSRQQDHARTTTTRSNPWRSDTRGASKAGPDLAESLDELRIYRADGARGPQGSLRSMFPPSPPAKDDGSQFELHESGESATKTTAMSSADGLISVSGNSQARHDRPPASDPLGVGPL